ncbi:MAG: hypothetical protein IJR49_01455, partial [Treponema sp.]|nr:hypothetical protein [Treponema sp.]
KRALKVKDISFNTYTNATLTLDNIVLESENKFKIAALGTLKLLGNASVKNGIVLEKGGTIEIVSPLTSASKMQVNIDAAGSGEVVIKNGAASISHFEFTKDVEIIGSDIRKK